MVLSVAKAENGLRKNTEVRFAAISYVLRFR